MIQTHIPYFIKYSVHMSIVRTLIFDDFWQKKVILKYLPNEVRRQYFIIIFFEKSGHYS